MYLISGRLAALIRLSAALICLYAGVDSSRRECREEWSLTSTDKAAVAARCVKRSRVCSSSASLAPEYNTEAVNTVINTARLVIAICSLVLSESLHRYNRVHSSRRVSIFLEHLFIIGKSLRRLQGLRGLELAMRIEIWYPWNLGIRQQGSRTAHSFSLYVMREKISPFTYHDSPMGNL